MRSYETWKFGATLRPHAHSHASNGAFGSGARNAPGLPGHLRPASPLFWKGVASRASRIAASGSARARRARLRSLAAGHVRHVSPGQASLVGSLPRELGAPLGDVPGGAYPPPGHAPRRQPRDRLGPYPPRRPRHFPSLSEWRMGQAWEAVALA